MNKFVLHNLDLELLSNETKARILIELELTGYDHMLPSHREPIERNIELLDKSLRDDIGNWEVVYDFVEDVRVKMVIYV